MSTSVPADMERVAAKLQAATLYSEETWKKDVVKTITKLICELRSPVDAVAELARREAGRQEMMRRYPDEPDEIV